MGTLYLQSSTSSMYKFENVITQVKGKTFRLKNQKIIKLKTSKVTIKINGRKTIIGILENTLVGEYKVNKDSTVSLSHISGVPLKRVTFEYITDGLETLVRDLALI